MIRFRQGNEKRRASAFLASTRTSSVLLFVLWISSVYAMTREGAVRFPHDVARGLHSDARKEALQKCSSPFKGKRPTKAEWERLLADHKEFLRTLRDPRDLHKSETRGDLRRANLCGAILADLPASGIDLSGANLSAANIAGANFEGALLWGADLSFVAAKDAVLTRAAINTGTLQGAWLEKAKLDGVILAYGNLRNAYLIDTNLHEANIRFADLSDAVFEPEVGTLPHFASLITVRNLDKVRFSEFPHVLLELRETFRKAGLRSHERDLTYAIKHTERLRAGWFERIANYVLFELTTEWGRTPARALAILACLIAIFMIPYAIALRRGGDDGIWRVWAESRLRKDLGEQQSCPLRVGWVHAIRLGLYFSVLSAFHVGWREFNIGDWIVRLQSQEYTLRATGWVRVVSGVQSLSSVYLFAIWVLTYFGRPFE